MRKDDEQWLNGIKNRLNQYEEPVPDSVWNSLQKELDPVVVPGFFKWKRMAVAASVASLFLLGAGGWLLSLSDEDALQEVRQYSEAIQTPADGILQSPNPSIDIVSQAGKDKQLADVAVKPAFRKRPYAEELKSAEPEEPLRTEEKMPQETAVCDSVTTDEQAMRKQPEKKGMLASAGRASSGYTSAMPVRKKENVQKWSVGVAYTNSMGGQHNTYQGAGTLAMNSNTSGGPLQSGSPVKQEQTIPQRAPQLILGNVAEAKTEINHKTPVTAGLSFRYQLPMGFALETGLNYTLLASELYASNDKGYYKESYRLHYLGIPLRASWTFLNKPFLSLYVSAGGELEKSLAGKYELEYATDEQEKVRWNDNVKPVQWSVQAALGVQFNATSHLGIFAEPGVVYYFDDGSNVQTIRKEKPLNFKLQLGVRWTY